MGACLNPTVRHAVAGTPPGQLMCPEPNCGFLLAGATVGRWQVSTLLGRGVRADLYLAQDTETAGSPYGTTMLVKVLRLPLITSTAVLERHADQLVSLRHPHIHPTLGVGWAHQAGALYLLSPYEQQGSLAHTHGAAAELPLLAVASIVRQIADALQFAHDQQLVHGGLKPENCLLVGPMTVRVCDFYRVLVAPTAAGPTDAAEAFVAPEQSWGQTEPASDQYALALITYLLLCGRLPFDEAPTSGIASAGIGRTPRPIRPIRQLRPDLPGAVEATLAHALRVLPDERLPSITAFATALQSALESPPAGRSSPVAGGFSPVPPPSWPGVTPLPRPGATPSPTPWPADTPSPFPRPPQVASPRLPGVTGATPVCLLPGHTAPVTQVRWAPDGRRLASGGGDMTVHLWSLQQRIGTPVATLAGHTGEVLALTWSPDAKLLASASADATMRIWNPLTATGRAARWGHDGNVAALDWSPDGQLLASGGTDRTIRLWDAQGAPLGTWQAHGRGGVSAVAWSPDGRVVASAGVDHLIHMWDPRDGRKVQTFEGHTEEVRALAWSPNGAWLASASRREHSVDVWNPRSGGLVTSFTAFGSEIVGLFWSAESSWLAIGLADASLHLWAADEHVDVPARLLLPVKGSVRALDFAPHSRLLALGLDTLLIQVVELVS